MAWKASLGSINYSSGSFGILLVINFIQSTLKSLNKTERIKGNSRMIQGFIVKQYSYGKLSNANVLWPYKLVWQLSW